MAGEIFISYRRGDDPGATGRLYDRLCDAFGPGSLFMDVAGIAPGDDFIRVLADRVGRCRVLLAVIGRDWLDARAPTGTRRIDDPNDFVAIEIASALERGKRVIPVLFGDTAMPRADQLPPRLRPLARRNAVRLTHERFRADADALLDVLRATLSEAAAAPALEGDAPSSPPARPAAPLAAADDPAVGTGAAAEISRRRPGLSRRALAGAAALGVAGAAGAEFWLRGSASTRRTDPAASRRLAGHEAGILAVAVAPDGKTALTGSLDGTLRVWHLPTAALVRTVDAHPDGVTAVAVLPDGRAAVSAGQDRTVRLWYLADGSETRRLDDPAPIRTVALAPDGRVVATVGLHGSTPRLRDFRTGQDLRGLPGHSGPVSSLAFSADGTRLVSGSADRSLRVWDVASGRALAVLTGHGDAVTAGLFWPDGRSVLSASLDGSVRRWTLDTGALLRTWSMNGARIEALALAPDGRFFVTGDEAGRVSRSPVGSGEAGPILGRHEAAVTGLAITPDGRFAASGSLDATAIVWDLASP